MSTIAIVGTQWGDEGKGKIVHLLGKEADGIVRYQGGPNAGHTVVFDGKLFVLHLIPAGILIPKKICFIANGVVIDPLSLYEEVQLLEKRNIKVSGRLFISELAHLILPYHKILDAAREDSSAAGSRKIGTTRKGIGPAYADKVERTGIRVIDYLEKDTFEELLEQNLKLKGKFLQGFTNVEKLRKDILDQAKKLRPFLKKFACDTSIMINCAIEKKKKVIFESAQGTMLDIDFGTYPYVTSSNPISGAVGSDCGIGPNKIDSILGIVKAYTTRVGEGPFPTELKDAVGERLREVGKEFGATTGRPRRCGWFDALVVQRSVRINGITKLALTKLDVLAGLETLKVCVAYSHRGKTVQHFPNSRTVIQECTPIYKSLPGFKEISKDARRWEDLPINAQRYVQYLQKLCGGRISFVSLGRSREETIRLDKSSLWS